MTTDSAFVAPVQELRRDPEQTGVLLADWLRPRLPGTDLQVLRVSTPDGTGVANETLMVDATWRDRDGRPQDSGFVVRVAAADPLYKDADVRVAHDAYAALADVPGVPVPQVYGYEPDSSLLGRPFFVMERIPGQVPADQPYYTDEGFVVDASAEDRRRMWEDAVDVMCRFHQVDGDRFGFLARPERGASGLEQDLAYWRDYYRWALGGRDHPTLAYADDWLADNLPPDPPTSPAWGDARVCNMIVRDFRVVGMLDWDGLSLAGGESDLGWWCVMEHSRGRGQTLPGLGTYDELVERWEERTGQHAGNMRWHMAYACYKLGAIVTKLNAQMLERGLLPAGTDISTNSDVVQQLTLLIDAPAAGPVVATLPPLSRL
jgi:aminoglycoside phosphotransferase (APT) family kinase protein